MRFVRDTSFIDGQFMEYYNNNIAMIFVKLLKQQAVINDE